MRMMWWSKVHQPVPLARILKSCVFAKKIWQVDMTMALKIGFILFDDPSVRANRYVGVANAKNVD
jgi:hypothetical protein